MDKVVPDAPWVIINNFTQKHHIDYVAHNEVPYAGAGQADIYYVLKEQGMLSPNRATVDPSDITFGNPEVSYNNILHTRDLLCPTIRADMPVPLSLLRPWPPSFCLATRRLIPATSLSSPHAPCLSAEPLGRPASLPRQPVSGHPRPLPCHLGPRLTLSHLPPPALVRLPFPALLGACRVSAYHPTLAPVSRLTTLCLSHTCVSAYHPLPIPRLPRSQLSHPLSPCPRGSLSTHPPTSPLSLVPCLPRSQLTTLGPKVSELLYMPTPGLGPCHVKQWPTTDKSEPLSRFVTLKEPTARLLTHGFRKSLRCLDVSGNKAVSGSYDATCPVRAPFTALCSIPNLI